MSSLTVDSARQALSAVIDPALGKDVIKLRIVSNIEVQGSDALVTVDIPTHAYPQAMRRELTSRIETALRDKGAARVTVMPRVVKELGGAEYYTWATMLYMVASIIGTAAGNPVRQMLGSRTGYAVAALVFAAGSAACALAPSMVLLLVARVIQGLGGGTMIALSMSLISELFPPHLRKRVLALVSATWGVASLLGPGIGGLFASAGFWRGAFWINVPIVLLFILACTRLPRKQASEIAIRFPYLQLALLTAGVAAVAMASQVAHLWAQVGLLAAAALAVALTIKLDQTSDNRMFPSHPLSLARVSTEPPAADRPAQPGATRCRQPFFPPGQLHPTGQPNSEKAGPIGPTARSYMPMPTYLVSRYSSIPSKPPSRPNPLCFTPPNGAAGFDTTPTFRPTMPVSIRSLTRIARCRSRVKT